MVFPYRQTFSSTVRAAAYTINVRSEAKYKVWQMNHEFCCMVILGCSMSPVCMLLLQPLFGGSGAYHHCHGVGKPTPC